MNKRWLPAFLLLLLLNPFYAISQDDLHSKRLRKLEVLLDSASTDIPGLVEKTTITFRDVPLAEYVRAIGIEHNINVYIQNTPDLIITTNLSREPVKNVFLFLCKQFSYTIEMTGTILEFHPFLPLEEIPQQVPRTIDLTFEEGMLKIDLQNDSLTAVVKAISEETGKKILVEKGLEQVLNGFLPPTPLDTALEALFESNGLRIKKRRKGYWIVENIEKQLSPIEKSGGSNRFFLETYTDSEKDYISIEAEEANLELVIKQIFEDLGVDYLLYDPLPGSISAYAEFSELDELLTNLLRGTGFSFKKEENLYLIGTSTHDWLQGTKIVKLKYRPTQQAIELIPGIKIISSGSTQQTVSGIPKNANQNRTGIGQNNFNRSNYPYQNQNNYALNQGINSPSSLNHSYNLTVSAPPPITKAIVGEVEVVEYPELNRLILKGPEDQILLLENFLLEIDRPVPMVRIEMIVVEVNKDRLLNTGVRGGLKTDDDTLSVIKSIIPGIDYTLNGEELNAIFGSIPSLSALGMLNKDVYLQLRAQESQGNLKVWMEPVLSMLNGREASLVIGQTQYFLLETTTSTTGAVNNFQQFTQRFERIDANVTLTLKPYISDDRMVTLDVLPDFTTPIGSFSADVPPTIATRRFVSTIRVRDGETVVLGGLTEKTIGENTDGLPWISRVPVLKWFFGNTRRTRTESSLLIYITPSIYYH